MLDITFEPISEEFLLSWRSAWEELSLNAVTPNPFLEPYMIESAMKMLVEHKTMALLISQNQTLHGVMLLHYDRGYAHMPIPHLKLAYHDHQFLGTPLIREGYEVDIAKRLIDWLDHDCPDAMFLYFKKLAMDDPFLTTLRSLASGQRPEQIVHHYERAMIKTSLSSEEYNKTQLSSKRRKNLNRLHRRLEEIGDVKFERLTNSEDIHQWTERFLTLEHESWKGDQGTSILSDSTIESYYRSFILDAFKRNKLAMTRLLVAGNDIAYALDIRAGNAVFSVKVAYDKQWHKYSPGVILEIHLMARYVDEDKVAYIDSCAAPNHSILTHIWGERRKIGEYVICKRSFMARLWMNIAFFLEAINHKRKTLSSKFELVLGNILPCTFILPALSC